MYKELEDCMQKTSQDFSDIGYSDLAGSLGMMTSLIKMAKIADSKLTPEERIERDKAREKERELNRMSRLVLKCICPYCEGKLVRGKKDKKNDYKRSWSCNKCESVFKK